jgi:hypothetical protein
MKDLLRPGGIVFTEVPNQFDSWRGMAGRFYAWLLQTQQKPTVYSVHHVNFFGPDHLGHFFQRNGFQTEITSYTSRDWRKTTRILHNFMDYMSEKTATRGLNIQVIGTKT